jgi:hypothetical protein
MKKATIAAAVAAGCITLALGLTIHAGGTKPTEDPTPEPQELIESAPTTYKVPMQIISLEDAELLGRVIWGEAGGVASETERAAVAWCVLNRVDAWDMTLEDVITEPGQFYGYRPWGECPQEFIDLGLDVLSRWAREGRDGPDTGRVLPEGYLYFVGDGSRNHFTEEWQSGDYWDWSLPSPYND